VIHYNYVLFECSGVVLVIRPKMQPQHQISSVVCQSVRRKNWKNARKKHRNVKQTTRRTLPSACMRPHQTPASLEASPTQRWWWGDGDRIRWNASCSRYGPVTMDQTQVCNSFMVLVYCISYVCMPYALCVKLTPFTRRCSHETYCICSKLPHDQHLNVFKYMFFFNFCGSGRDDHQFFSLCALTVIMQFSVYYHFRHCWCETAFSNVFYH